MSTLRTIKDLEQTIGALLMTGLEVSEETLFFAESMYGIDPDSLGQVLADESFEGYEALIELIFTPEPDVRSAVEPVLGDTGLGEAALEILGEALKNDSGTINLILPGKTEPCTIDLDDAAIGLFLRKLYLDRPLAPEILRALEQTFSADTVIAARVMMRCRGSVFDETKRKFMCRFITRSGAYENRFPELLGLVLALLAEIGDGDPIEAYLIKKKRAQIATLKDIRMFNAKREQYSMEYLMMQRYKIPHESEEETLGLLYLLTTVTDVILGLPPDPSLRASAQDLGDFTTTAGIDNLIKLLS